MRTLLFLLLCAAAGRAQEPAAGKVLVLDNERTLEGEIDRVGDEYRVRRSFGATTIPAGRVLKLCGSKQEALAFLRQRANPEDPDERLRLARWCHLQELRQEAIAEVRAALSLRPDHAESRRLLHYFEEWAKQSTVSKPAAVPTGQTRTGPPPVSISVESMAEFTRHVQPILMNACARCHANSGNTSAFRLERTQGLGMSNRRAVQDNVSAVLAQVYSQQPTRSPLLIKAISAHGPAADAPIKGRQASAFRTLEDWVKLTLTSNPHLQDVLKPPPTLVQTEPSNPEPEKPEPKKSGPKQTEPKDPATLRPPSPPVRGDVAVKPAAPEPTQPARTVPVQPSATPPPQEPEQQPESEFDPLPFNRRFHPGGKNAAPPTTPPRKDGE